jgi:hypothetical protein
MASIQAFNYIVLNQGNFELFKTNADGLPTIVFDDKYKSYLAIHDKNETLYIESSEPDVTMKFDLNSLQNCYITIMTGSIEARALASKRNKNYIKMGAIVLHLKREEIGSLYMRVTAGIIIADSSVQVIPHKAKGYEAFFQGALQHQDTTLIVEAGAIICHIV